MKDRSGNRGRGAATAQGKWAVLNHDAKWDYRLYWEPVDAELYLYYDDGLVNGEGGGYVRK